MILIGTIFALGAAIATLAALSAVRTNLKPRTLATFEQASRRADAPTETTLSIG